MHHIHRLLKLIVSLIMISSWAFAQQHLPEESQDVSATSLDLYHEAVPDMEVELSRFKRQALQSVSVSSGWMSDVGGSGLSTGYFETSIGSGLPLGDFENILGVRPSFRIDWIDAISTIDIPDELYQFELQLFYRRALGDRLSALAIVSPSVRSDLTTSDDAFRVFALGLLSWEYIPNRLVLAGGVVHLGRDDLPLLPAIGLTWTPSPRAVLDLRFPSSKLSYRLAKDGGRSEIWTYTSCGLGGNTWSVTRRSAATDQVSLRDIRLVLGIERLLDGGGGWFAESGFAFARQIEYESEEGEVELNDGFLIQAGWRY